jgi:membrane protease YdiL (CAAX protease family)
MFTPKELPWGPVAVVFLTVLIYFASQIVSGVLVSLYPFLRGWSGAATQAWLTNSVIAQFFLILLVEAFTVGAVLFLLRMRQMKPKDIGLKKPRRVDVVYALAGFGIYFLIYAALFIAIRFLFPQINLEQKQELGFQTGEQGFHLVLIFISLVILPPIAEEIVCRGFLYTGLRSKLAFLPSAVITSVLFALAHLQFGSGAPLLWTAAIDTFVLSVVLVYLRERTGSLAAPMMLHMLKNFLAFALIFIFMMN